MSNFEIFKMDLNDAVKISIIRAINGEKANDENDVVAALDDRVMKYIENKECNVFASNSNRFVRIVLEGINDDRLSFVEL